MFEYALYFILPFFLGYIGERYKFMSTYRYAAITLGVIIFLNIFFYFKYGGKLLDNYTLTISLGYVIFTVPFFHFLKCMEIRKLKKKQLKDSN